MLANVKFKLRNGVRGETTSTTYPRCHGGLSLHHSIVFSLKSNQNMSTSTSSTHRPRKKNSTATPAPGSGPVITDSYPPRPAFPLASFLWPAKKSTSQWVILPLVLMVVGLFRWALGFWGYSGVYVMRIGRRVRVPH